jgi:hypothetical protein
MIDVEPLIVSELERMLPLPDGGLADWTDVLRRSGLAGPSERRRWRPVLVLAVVVAALVGVGVAIANGFGVFNGIGAAQHPQRGADVLDAKTLANLQKTCPGDNGASIYMPFCHLLLNSTRLIGKIPSIGNVYVVTNTRGDLCTIWEGGSASCGPPLSESQPITFGTFNPSPTTGGTFVASGLALDGVSSVSFTVSGKGVTVPVKDNAWFYEEPNSHASLGYCVLAHLADGSTISPFPEVPCPSGVGAASKTPSTRRWST